MTVPDHDRLLSAVAEVAREDWWQLAAEDTSDEVFADLSDAELQELASSVSSRLQRAQTAAPEARRGTGPQLRLGFARRIGWLAAAAAVLGVSLWLLRV